jgi:hypothetical protein
VFVNFEKFVRAAIRHGADTAVVKDVRHTRIILRGATANGGVLAVRCHKCHMSGKDYSKNVLTAGSMRLQHRHYRQHGVEKGAWYVCLNCRHAFVSEAECKEHAAGCAVQLGD